MARQGDSEVGECSPDKHATAQSAAQTEQSSQPGPPDLLQFLHLQSGRPELLGKSQLPTVQGEDGRGKYLIEKQQGRTPIGCEYCLLHPPCVVKHENPLDQ